MTHLLHLTREGTTPEIDRPAPEKVLSGDPVHTNWSLEERGNIFSGLWHTTVGKWRCDYSEWEYVHIWEGHSILTDEAGQETHLRAGDSYVIRPGFQGTWEAVEPTLKDYVIIT